MRKQPGNKVYFVRELSKVRDFYFMLEQPHSSVMPHIPIMKTLIRCLGLVRATCQILAFYRKRDFKMFDSHAIYRFKEPHNYTLLYIHLYFFRPFPIVPSPLCVIAKVFTWLGIFGHRLQKGTQLWSSLPGSKSLIRKMTKRKKAMFQKRREHSKMKDYKKHPNGTVSGGRDLQSTSIYPMGFCRAVFTDA